MPSSASHAKGRNIPSICLWITVCISAITLLGWLLDLPLLRTAFGISEDTSPVFAIALISASLGLALNLQKPTRRAFTALAIGPLFLLAGLRLAQQYLSWDATNPLLALLPGATRKPIDMGSAIILLMLGFAVLLIKSPQHGWRLLGRSLAAVSAFLGTLLILSWLLRVGTPAPDGAASIQLLTGLALASVSIGVVIAGAPADVLDRAQAHRELRRRINLALAVALGIIVVTIASTQWGGQRVAKAVSARKISFLVQSSAADLRALVQNAESGAQGLLLTGNGAFANEVSASSARLTSVMDSARSRMTGDSNQLTRLEEMVPLVQQKLAATRSLVEFERQGMRAMAVAAMRSPESLELSRRVNAQLDKITETEDSNLAQLDAELRRSTRVSMVTNLLAGFIAIFFLVLGWMTINRDIDRRGIAEAALEEGEKRLAQIVDLIPSVVFLKDPKTGRYLSVNRAGEVLIGLSRNEMIGQTDHELFPPAEADASVITDQLALTRDEVLDVADHPHTSRALGLRTVHTRKVVVKDGTGQPLFLLGISDDVTERQQKDEALRAAKEAAEIANHAKSAFLAKMSHELRTPLNSIIGFSEILEDGTVGDLNERQLRYVGNVLSSGRNLLQLINDILDLSKVEAGRMEMVPIDVDVSLALEESCSLISALADRKEITLSVEPLPAPVRMHTDPARFRQIMLNLIGNAIKFTAAGGRVTVRADILPPSPARSNAEWLEIQVADTGVGIKPEDRERIFEEFEQVEAGADHSLTGTGLGLALARKLVELQGGTIRVESEVGVGSIFRFTMPLSRPGSDLPFIPSQDVTGPLVLIIDDEVHARDLMAFYLSEAGYRIATAESGEVAVELAERLRPDAITLDLLMPDQHGFDTLTALKRHPATTDIPIVVVSVSDRDELGFSLGASEWIVKPIQRRTLISVIERTIRAGDDAAVPRILVIDDDPAVLEQVTQTLTTRGYDVSTASGGHLGIEMVRARRPDVVILDLMMPEVNGFEVLRTLRADPDVGAVPIIILTSKDLTVDEQVQLRESSFAIVPKAGREQLLEELQRVCAPETVA